MWWGAKSVRTKLKMRNVRTHSSQRHQKKNGTGGIYAKKKQAEGDHSREAALLQCYEKKRKTARRGVKDRNYEPAGRVWGGDYGRKPAPQRESVGDGRTKKFRSNEKWETGNHLSEMQHGPGGCAYRHE